MKRMKSLKYAAAAFAFVLAALQGCEFSSAPGGGTGGEGLTGIVVDERGTPVAGARVRVYPAKATLAKSTASAVAKTDSTFTGFDGRYRFKKLPSGTYNLEVAFRLNDTAYSLFLPDIVFEKKRDLGVDTLRVSGAMSLRVQGVADAPLAGAECRIAGSPWTAISDGDGVCFFAALAPGEHRVFIRYEGRDFPVNVTVRSGARIDEGPVRLDPAHRVPFKPLLLGPLNDTLVHVNSGSVILSWTSFKDPGTSYYRLQISLDNSFSTILYADSMPFALHESVQFPPDSQGRMFRPLSWASGGKTYYWRVWGEGPGGATVSAIRRFTASIPLAGPQLSIPEDRVRDVNPNVLLSWNGTPPPSMAVLDYVVQIGLDSLFLRDIYADDTVPVGTSSWQVPYVADGWIPGRSLLENHVYFWRVITRGPKGEAASQVRRFTTAAVPPYARAPGTPAQNAVGISLSPTLYWAEPSFDPVDFVASYRVQLASDSAFTNLVANVVTRGNGVPVGPLQPATRYYWRIFSYGEGGSYSEPQIASFTTAVVWGED